MAGTQDRTGQDLAGKVVLVTGASRGIGYAAAIEAARRGAHVVAVARTVGGLEELDDEIQDLGSSATLVPLDLRDGDAAILQLRKQRLHIAQRHFACRRIARMAHSHRSG